MLELLRVAAELLAKSKNARNWRRYEGGDAANGPLKPRTIDRRMDRYLTGLGLGVGHDPVTPDDDVAPTPRKNQIETEPVGEGLLTSEHEAAHAIMTPSGRKMRNYFNWLHAQNELERTTRRSGRRTREQEEAEVPGMRHERIAQALSPKIQRRAGVAPGAHREYYPHDDYTSKEYRNGNGNMEGDISLARRHGDKAKQYIRRMDRGYKFDEKGTLTFPAGVDAAINTRARTARRPPQLIGNGAGGSINLGGGNLTNSRAALDMKVNRNVVRERGVPERVAPVPEPKR